MIETHTNRSWLTPKRSFNGASHIPITASNHRHHILTPYHPHLTVLTTTHSFITSIGGRLRLMIRQSKSNQKTIWVKCKRLFLSHDFLFPVPNRYQNNCNCPSFFYVLVRTRSIKFFFPISWTCRTKCEAKTLISFAVTGQLFIHRHRSNKKKRKCFRCPFNLISAIQRYNWNTSWYREQCFHFPKSASAKKNLNVNACLAASLFISR